HEVVEVIVGLPRTLANRQGPAAELAIAYAEDLAGRIAPVPVRLGDERLTTVTASRILSQRGVKGRKQRAVVDQAAPVEILQAWIDAVAAHRAREGERCPSPRNAVAAVDACGSPTKARPRPRRRARATRGTPAAVPRLRGRADATSCPSRRPI